MCFSDDSGRHSPGGTRVFDKNEFGTGRVFVDRAEALCVPSFKAGPQATTGIGATKLIAKIGYASHHTNLPVVFALGSALIGLVALGTRRLKRPLT